MQRLAIAVSLCMIVAAPLVAETDPASEEKSDAEARAHKWLKRIRLIEIRDLRDPASFQEGRKKLMDIGDPWAVPPLMQVLYGANARYRALLIEVLESQAADGSPPAEAYLQEIAVGDGNRMHRRRAVKALARGGKESGTTPTNRLMAYAAAGRLSEMRNRAAEALAQLDEKRAAWILVPQLVTTERRLKGADVTTSNMMLDIRAQVASVERPIRQVVIEAAGFGTTARMPIELPVVDVVDIKTTVAMKEVSSAPVYEDVNVQHPRILAALKKLTGKDFGYNEAAWSRWLETRPDNIPVWEPLQAAAKKIE